ncbi:unnamed protein product [Meganyctiphanes norvegica]|uniref:Uncharacterized protein n=1 Tax=Meganyctiphanes norvegica TaxID=48144 RepID=A0AAV2PX47_MEGNR
MGKLTVLCVAILLGAVFAGTELEMWNAAKEGDLTTVNKELATDTDPNWRNPDSKNQGTALHAASASNHPAMVRLLLRARADKDIMNKEGQTPISVASYFGFTEVVIVLAARGANVNIPTNTGITALMSATEAGHLSVVEALIAAHANLTLSDNQGDTALHYAAWKNEEDIAMVLLQAGADPRKQDNSGNTPADDARQYVNIKLAIMIDGFTRITTQLHVTTATPCICSKLSLIITGIVCGTIVFIAVTLVVHSGLAYCARAQPQPHLPAQENHNLLDYTHVSQDTIYETLD